MIIAFTCLWGAVAWWTLSGLAPHLGHAAGVHSDAAIPQLMANAARLTPMHLYYWGQNRFGGWPFILEWIVHRVFGFGWTPDRLYWLMCATLGTSVWPLIWLGGETGLALASGFLVILVGCPTVRVWLLDTSQPYAWQLCTFAWSWWTLRQFAEERTGGLWVRASALCLLTIWMSPLSAPLLVIVVVIETLRRRFAIGRLAAAVAPVAFGAIGEHVLNVIHHAWASTQHIWYQKTELEIDFGYLAQDWRHQWTVLAADPWWWMLPAACALCVLISRRRPKGTATTFIWTALALATFVAMTVLSWTRSNDYSPRYLAIVYVFGGLGALSGAGTFLGRRLWPDLGAGLALLVTAVLLAPVRTPPTDADHLVAACVELPRRQPGGVLLGGYWGTYIFVDGTAETPMIPVVDESDFNRTPWTIERLRTASSVVVSHYQETRFGTADDPVPFIQEYDVLLKLETPHWLVAGPFTFSLYRNVSAPQSGVTLTIGGTTQRTPDRLLPYPQLPDTQRGTPLLDVDVTPRRPGQMLLFFGAPGEANHALPKLAALESNRQDAVPLVEHRPVVAARFDGTSRLTFAYADDAPHELTSLRSVWFLPDP